MTRFVTGLVLAASSALPSENLVENWSFEAGPQSWQVKVRYQFAKTGFCSIPYAARFAPRGPGDVDLQAKWAHAGSPIGALPTRNRDSHLLSS